MTRPHATYPWSLSEYLAFFRTCGTLSADEVQTAITYSNTMSRLRWQLRGE